MAKREETKDDGLPSMRPSVSHRRAESSRSKVGTSVGEAGYLYRGAAGNELVEGAVQQAADRAGSTVTMPTRLSADAVKLRGGIHGASSRRRDLVGVNVVLATLLMCSLAA